MRRALALGALVLLAGCSADGPDMRHHPTTSPGTEITSGFPTNDPTYPMPTPGTCHVAQLHGQAVPDHHCTPGAVNADVSEATIAKTICVRGWTATIRPPRQVTDEWKARSAASYGEKVSDGEYDHFIPLELGGAPLDTRNLWVEPGPIPNEKDKVESYLRQQVCDHKMTLVVAQQSIATDWTIFIHLATGSDPGNENDS